ncbi:MAG: carboxypeptidase-like regulatory domain-containing protein, partial [Nanoarchaeota archaeon]
TLTKTVVLKAGDSLEESFVHTPSGPPPPPPPPPPGKCEIYGAITDKSGTPIKSAISLLAGGTAVHPPAAYTGSYVLTGLAPGTYDVVSTPGGPFNTITHNVVLKAGDRKEVKFEHDASGTPPPPPPGVSIVITKVTPSSAKQDAGVVRIKVEGQNLNLISSIFFPYHSDPTQQPLHQVGNVLNPTPTSFEMDIDVTKDHHGKPTNLGFYDIHVEDAARKPTDKAKVFEIKNAGGIPPPPPPIPPRPPRRPKLPTASGYLFNIIKQIEDEIIPDISIDLTVASKKWSSANRKLKKAEKLASSYFKGLAKKLGQKNFDTRINALIGGLVAAEQIMKDTSQFGFVIGNKKTLTKNLN